MFSNTYLICTLKGESSRSFFLFQDLAVSWTLLLKWRRRERDSPASQRAQRGGPWHPTWQTGVEDFSCLHPLGPFLSLLWPQPRRDPMHDPLALQQRSVLSPAAGLSLLPCKLDCIAPLRTLQCLSLLLRGKISLYQLTTRRRRCHIEQRC